MGPALSNIFFLLFLVLFFLFQTLEKQLEETLAERAEIRQELNGSRARNKRLTEELASLKEEFELLQKKTKDDNALIDSLTVS